MNDLARMAEYYRPQYGTETDALFAAFLKENDKIALSDGLLKPYFLDQSSIMPALLLPLEDNMRVLDLCSAPGGKLLVMISRGLKNLHIVANDLSPARTNRLRRVIEEHVPINLLPNIKITTKDGSYFGLRQANSFDAVLVDAPCSSEAHIARNPRLLAAFSGLRKSLPHRQYALLCSALLALKPGGYLMYATCSINTQENEEIIKRLLKKKGHQLSLIEIDNKPDNTNTYGINILPHKHGYGPAFFSLLRKIKPVLT